MSDLFPVNLDVLARITTSIRANGYDQAHPIQIATGKWNGSGVVCDGHTRLRAARAAGISEVPVIVKQFDSLEDALRYSIAEARDRHNRTDAEIHGATTILDSLKQRGGDRRSEKAKTTEDQKPELRFLKSSAEETAKALGVSRDKVEKSRKKQLAGTKWAQLNSETWVLTWKDPMQVKNRQPHEIALDGRPLEVIRDRWEARKSQGDLACPYIFDNEGKPIGDFKRAWASACRKAGFPLGRKNGGYVFHNTRHTAVTNLVNAGVPSHEAMGVSGHRTRSVFDRYSIRLHEPSSCISPRASSPQALEAQRSSLRLPARAGLHRQ